MSTGKLDKRLNQLLETWWYVRGLTYQYLDHVSQKHLVKKLPRPALDQIGKHFLEMGDVTMVYAEGLRTGNISFEKVRWEFPRSEVESKKALVAHLKKSDRALRKAFEIGKGNIRMTYELGGEKLSFLEVVTWLTLHEILHHGQLISYGYLLETGFPDEWIQQWALPKAHDK